jgi:hypothetical protein
VLSFSPYLDNNCAAQFSSIIIRLSRGISSGENTGNAAISSLGHFRPNNRTFEHELSISVCSGTKSDVQIRLERTTHGSEEIEMDGLSANKQPNNAK